MPDPTRLERMIRVAKTREGLSIDAQERTRLLTQHINALFSRMRDAIFQINKALRARRVEIKEDPKVPFAIGFEFLGSRLDLALSPEGEPTSTGPGTPLLGVYRLEYEGRTLASGAVHLHPEFLDISEEHTFVDEAGRPIDWDDILERLLAPPD